ncbi:MAG: hypothetical protein WKG07_29550 [Hymenobacter sp.]
MMVVSALGGTTDALIGAGGRRPAATAATARRWPSCNSGTWPPPGGPAAPGRPARHHRPADPRVFSELLQHLRRHFCARRAVRPHPRPADELRRTVLVAAGARGPGGPYPGRVGRRPPAHPHQSRHVLARPR